MATGSEVAAVTEEAVTAAAVRAAARVAVRVVGVRAAERVVAVRAEAERAAERVVAVMEEAETVAAMGCWWREWSVVWPIAVTTLRLPGQWTPGRGSGIPLGLGGASNRALPAWTQDTEPDLT